MNQSEINNLGTLLVAVLGPVLVKYGVSQNDLAQLIPAVVAIGWGVYSHWNMKKVPEGSKIMSNIGKAGT
jgi:C4-dicarboxylate transporter